MRAFAEPRLRRRQDRVAASAQGGGDLAPAPSAVPGAMHQHESLSGRCAGGPDPIDGEAAFVQPAGAGRILDRQARHAGADAACDVPGDALGVVRVPGLEIRVHRDARRGGHLFEVPQHPFERNAGVGQRLREGESGRGGGEGLEAEMLEVDGAAGVPRVRQDEAAFFVQRAKGGDFRVHGRAAYFSENGTSGAEGTWSRRQSGMAMVE